MMNCREVSRLVAEGADRDLRFYEQMRVRIHLVMCYMCRRFTRQLALIRRVSRAAGADSLLADGSVLQSVTLSPDAKSRLKEKIAHNNSGE